MNAASNNNGNASATPQQNAHSRYSKLTEAEFLAHEAELAKTAITTALTELKSSLAQAVDVKLWAHHYPWLTVGAAAATGFTLAAIVKGGGADNAKNDGEEETRKRLVREAAEAPHNSAPGGTKARLGNSLLGSLFSLARTALEASLVSAIHAQGIERAESPINAGSATAPEPVGVSPGLASAASTVH